MDRHFYAALRLWRLKLLFWNGMQTFIYHRYYKRFEQSRALMIRPGGYINQNLRVQHMLGPTKRCLSK